MDWKGIKYNILKNLGLWPLYNMNKYIAKEIQKYKIHKWRLQVRGNGK